MRLLRYLLPLLLVPQFAFAAYTVPLSATSTSGTILAYPTAVNGVLPILASPFFVATSTTKSILPYASSTGITVSKLFSGGFAFSFPAEAGTLAIDNSGTPGDCVVYVDSILLGDVGSPCGAAYPFTPGTFGSTKTSATTTAISDSAGFMASSTSYFQGIQNFGWTISTTTTVCAYNCTYTDIPTAVAAGWKNIQLKSEVYTLSAPIVINASNINIVGEGHGTQINFNAATVPTAFLNDSTTQHTDIVVKNVFFNQTGTGGTGTCMDISRMALSYFENTDCKGSNLGIIATTTSTFYNTIVSPTVQVSGASGQGIAFTNGAIFNTVFNSRVNPSNDDRVTGYVIAAHDIHCLPCEVETYAGIGVDIQSGGDNFEGDLYAELNKINVQVASGVESVRITGAIESASTTAQNIVDNGASCMTVNARVEFDPLNYTSSGCAPSFKGGIIASASSTIGNDTRTTGLAINGSATTTFPGTASIPNYFTIFNTGSQAGQESGLSIGGYQGNIFHQLVTKLNAGGNSADFIIKNGKGATVTEVARIAGATGNFGYGTSTPWGLFSINATSTGNFSAPLFVIASSTVTATTTLFQVNNVGTASTTNLVDSALVSGNCVQASTGGLLTTVAAACGTGGFAFPFTSALNFSTTTAATTSSIWLQGGSFFSSSTVASQLPYASSTAMSAQFFCFTGDTCKSAWPTGTVTSITGGTGISGGTISTTGTFALLSYLATSSAETNGQIPYWTSLSGTPAKLGSVATSSQTFSSGFSLSGTMGATVGGTTDTISLVEHHSFTYPAVATTTWMSATTTIPLEVGYGEVWNTMQCYTDTGTLNVQIGYGTASTTDVVASTTIGTNQVTPNNTMTAGNKVKVDIGTPASTPHQLTCTVKDTL